MGRTKTPPSLKSIPFRSGNYVVVSFGHWVPFSTRLRKEYNYTPTGILGNCGLFYFKHCLLLARKVRRSLLQYIMYRTAVVVIAVLPADSSGRTVLR